MKKAVALTLVALATAALLSACGPKDEGEIMAPLPIGQQTYGSTVNA